MKCTDASLPALCNHVLIADQGQSKGSAKAKCEAYVDRRCGVAVACGQFTSKSQCNAWLVLGGLDCNFAVAVGSSYDDCMSSLLVSKCRNPAYSPYEYYDFPALCKQAIIVE
ncbi:MAG: hypothetical protein FWD57_17230 [Polyangiaceae bacterium]|nr:hypothetical protein [Polyangiaceae bacterium]